MDETIEQIEAEARALDGGPGQMPAKAGGAPPGVDIPLRDMLQGVFSITFSVVAARAGGHWKINDAEAGALAEAWDAYISSKWPDIQAGPGWLAVATTAAVCGPRIMAGAMAKKRAPAAQSKKKKAQNDDDKGGEHEQGADH